MDNNDNKRRLRRSITVASVVVFFMWVLEIFEFATGISLVSWGIYPRAIDGLLGIFTAPFVHGDWGHLITNSAPMFMLTAIIMYFYPRVAMPTFFIITVSTGLLVWFFARNSYHIGASGVVYGYVSFVFWTGVFRRNTRAIVLALIILTVYAGYFTGIVPDMEKQNISWESHLLGGVSGILTAFFFKNTLENDEIEARNPWKNEPQREHLFPRDLFEKTKYERYMEELRRQQALEEARRAWMDNRIM